MIDLEQKQQKVRIKKEILKKVQMLSMKVENKFLMLSEVGYFQ